MADLCYLLRHPEQSRSIAVRCSTDRFASAAGTNMNDVTEHPHLSGEYHWTIVRTRCQKCRCVVDRLVSMVLTPQPQTLPCFICGSGTLDVWLRSFDEDDREDDQYGRQVVIEENGSGWALEWEDDALPLPSKMQARRASAPPSRLLTDA